MMDKKKIVIASSKQWQSSLKRNLADQLNATVIEINKKEAFSKALMDEHKPDYIFFPHWSYFIPKEIYENYRCIVFHMTDLPFGRGGSPLQNLIQRGYKTTKISAISVVKEIDAGDVYCKEPLALSGSAQEIFECATQLIEKMMIKICIENPQPIPQAGKVEIFKRRTPDQSNIADLEDLQKVYDYIRMLDADTYPRAFLKTDHLNFEFSGAESHKDVILAQVKITKKGCENGKK